MKQWLHYKKEPHKSFIKHTHTLFFGYFFILNKTNHAWNWHHCHDLGSALHTRNTNILGLKQKSAAWSALGEAEADPFAVTALLTLGEVSGRLKISSARQARLEELAKSRLLKVASSAGRELKHDCNCSTDLHVGPGYNDWLIGMLLPATGEQSTWQPVSLAWMNSISASGDSRVLLFITGWRSVRGKRKCLRA